MQVLSIIRSVIRECVKVITFGAKIQGDTRAQLIASLQEICDNCETAYSKVRSKLLPVKNAPDAKQLATALRTLAADAETRDAFKPEHICGKIDNLLNAFQNNLDPMKYAVDMLRISTIQDQLRAIGNFDLSIREQYNQFSRALDQLANQLDAASPAELHDLTLYVRRTIEDFEDELSRTVTCVREAKQKIAT
jgi:hypothetical protein